jgi:hypothetical protein
MGCHKTLTNELTQTRKEKQDRYLEPEEGDRKKKRRAKAEKEITLLIKCSS